MFISRIVLAATLLISSFSFANTPAEPQLTQEELAMVAQFEQAMQELVRQMNGLYIVHIEQLPVKNNAPVMKILIQASQSENCLEVSEEKNSCAIIFKGPEGKREAEALVKEVSKYGCTAELVELN